MVLFLSFNTDEDARLLKGREPGQYEALIPLPTEILEAGSHMIGLGSGFINQPSRTDHQHFDNFMTFEVRETTATLLLGMPLIARGPSPSG